MYVEKWDPIREEWEPQTEADVHPEWWRELGYWLEADGDGGEVEYLNEEGFQHLYRVSP